jgi:hypothetical protein
MLSVLEGCWFKMPPQFLVYSGLKSTTRENRLISRCTLRVPSEAKIAESPRVAKKSVAIFKPPVSLKIATLFEVARGRQYHFPEIVFFGVFLAVLRAP